MKVASAGQWVNSASSAMAGSSSSQPWMLALRRLFTEETPCSMASPVRLQDSLRLGLGVLHGLLGRPGAGERRLQAVVQSLGDALVLVGGQFGNGELELIARDRCRREVGDVFLHSIGVIGVG